MSRPGIMPAGIACFTGQSIAFFPAESPANKEAARHKPGGQVTDCSPPRGADYCFINRKNPFPLTGTQFVAFMSGLNWS